MRKFFSSEEASVALGEFLTHRLLPAFNCDITLYKKIFYLALKSLITNIINITFFLLKIASFYRRAYLRGLSSLYQSLNTDQGKNACEADEENSNSHSREYKGDSDRQFVFTNNRPCILYQSLLFLGQAEFLVYLRIVVHKIEQNTTQPCHLRFSVRE